MVANILGYYLVEIGQISMDEFKALIRITEEERVRLGLIAVSEGLMTEEQTRKVNKRQAKVDKKFGEIAVDMGYLTKEQVDYLLTKQHNEYVVFLQALEDMDLIKGEKALEIIENYVEDNGLKPELVDALKSGDIDRIIDGYIPDELMMFKEQIGIAIRTIIRCVDREVALKKATIIQSLKSEGVGSFQTVDDSEGDAAFTMGLMEEGGGFLKAANLFAMEDFHNLDMDALDSCAELLNCINGLYVSMRSTQGIDLELLPPDMMAEKRIRTADNVMCEIPLLIRGEKLRLILWN